MPTRRIRITLDVEDGVLADLAEEAIKSGADLNRLIVTRYLAGKLAGAEGADTAERKRRGRRAGKQTGRVGTGKRPYAVRDFPHLFHLAPPGQNPYRGSGRPPQWLLNLIEEELRTGKPPVPTDQPAQTPETAEIRDWEGTTF